MHDLVSHKVDYINLVTWKQPSHSRRPALSAHSNLSVSSFSNLPGLSSGEGCVTGGGLNVNGAESVNGSRVPGDFSQKTAVIEFMIKRLRDDIGPNANGLQELLDSLSLQVADVAGGLRAASHRLHPSVLENLGLPTALRMLVEEQRLRNDEIGFMERGKQVPLPPSHTTALYRIAQEAVRNAAKHATGAPVRIALIYGETDVELRIEDAGAGFDLKTVNSRGGLGSFSMQERARSIGATFDIASEISEGTNISVRVPLEKSLSQVAR
jgi:signal transduction histidine kinase